MIEHRLQSLGSALVREQRAFDQSIQYPKGAKDLDAVLRSLRAQPAVTCQQRATSAYRKVVARDISQRTVVVGGKKLMQLANLVPFERLDDQALCDESLRRQIFQLAQDEVGTAQTEREPEQFVQHVCIAKINPDIGVADVDLCCHQVAAAFDRLASSALADVPRNSAARDLLKRSSASPQYTRDSKRCGCSGGKESGSALAQPCVRAWIMLDL